MEERGEGPTGGSAGRPPGERDMPETDPVRQTDRLVELVVELTGAGADEARAAVEAAEPRRRQALAVVAAAVDDLRRPLPTGMRLAGYVRDDAHRARPPGREPTA